MQPNRKRPAACMWELVRANIWPFLGAMVSTIMIVLIGFMTPILLAETIDSVLGTAPSTLPAWLLQPIEALGGREFLRQNLWVLGAVLVGLNLINGVFTFFKGRLSAVASENIALTLRESLYSHPAAPALFLPRSCSHGQSDPALHQRCKTIRRFLSVQVMEVVNTVLLVTISLIILIGKNVTITLYSMILVPALFAFATWFFNRVHKGFRVMDEAEGKMSAVLQENLTGVRVVRAFGQQQREVDKFDEASSDFRNKARHLNDLLAIYWGGGDALSMLQAMITLLICVVYASRGEITVGALIIFTTYVSQLLFPIRQLGRTLSDAGKSLISMERIQDILSSPAEPEEPNALKPDLHGDIVFDHVSFAYDNDEPILKDVSFTIPAGKTVAVLGGTGSGKSTLMYLFQRLYEPTSGTISIGGVPLNKIDREYLRSHVGLILQEPFLYSKSIRDNVGIALNRSRYGAHCGRGADRLVPRASSRRPIRAGIRWWASAA